MLTLLQIDKMSSLTKHQVVKTGSGQNVNATKCFGTKFYFFNLFSESPTNAKVRVTRRLEKNLPNFSKNSPKSHPVKKGQNIYKRAQFESPKHLH